MLSIRNKTMIRCILNHPEGITGRQISERLKVSPKTVRNDLVAVNEWLGKYGCRISASKKTGYYIAEKDRGGILHCLEIQEAIENKLPCQTPKERKYAILDRILGRPGIGVYELADRLGVSEQTLYKDISALERSLKEYYGCSGIRMEDHRLFLRGSEYEIRRMVFCLIQQCIMSSDHVMDSCLYQLMRGIVNLDEIHTFHQYGWRYCKEHQIMAPDQVLHICTWTIFYCNVRREEGYFLEKEDKPFVPCDDLGRFLAYMNDTLFLELGDEDLTLLYHLLETLGFQRGQEPGQEVRRICGEFLELVKERYQLSFDSNEPLKENLCYHLDCMIRRMQLDCQLDNPLKEEIRRNYGFAYEAAMLLANIVYEHFHRYPREDEISLMAVYIQSSIQGGLTVVKAQLVYGSHMGYLHLLSRWLNQNFSGRLEICGICPQYLLEEECVQNQADLVLSTAPLKIRTGLPEMTLEGVPAGYEKEKLEKLIQEAVMLRISQQLTATAFSEAGILFFEGENTLEEMIGRCSKALEEEGSIKDSQSFTRGVMEREKVYPTHLANGCYMPHPLGNVAEKNCSCVGIARPGSNKKSGVSLIFVMALSRNVEKEFSKIYELVQLIADTPELIKKLQACQEKTEVIQQLCELMKHMKHR